MLESIHVQNMALIDEAFVRFGPKLNILTGETGAGKSVIIGSVSMALGGKASRDIIRTGAKYASAELVFTDTGLRVRQLLEELDLPVDGDAVTISRRLTQTRSVARINGEAVSVAILQQLAGQLIDIHGQHEHQSLLHRENQIAILDRYARDKTGPLKSELSSLWKQYTAIKKECAQAVTDQAKRNSEIDFLRFQIGEIDDAALVEGEEEKLDKAFRKMSNARDMMENVARAHSLTGDDAQDGAGSRIGEAIHELSAIERFDEGLTPLLQQLNDVEALLNDFNRDLASYEEDLVFDEEEYQRTQDRLSLILHLKSKYGSSVGEVLAYRDACAAKLDRLVNYEAYLTGLQKRMKESKEKVAAVCSRLTTVRTEAAKVLEKQMTDSLIDLNFLDVRFQIRVSPLEHFTENGGDDVEFLISTNPGEAMRPLEKVASGGELSRIMLAVKSVLADSDAVQTLIFDEIDTGISGRTAQKVSEKMAGLADSHQLICITHLPQIAAMADSHFLIEKSSDGSRTAASIHLLKEDESIKELARMLGGVQITDAVLASAGEMRSLAEREKKALRQKKS